MITVLTVHAQDIIIKKNGDELRAKIKEINATDIIFNYFDSLQSPLYIIGKKEVFMIRYASGVKDVFSQQNESLPGKKILNGGRIIDVAGRYSQNGINLSYGRLFSIIEQSNNQAAINEVNLARKAKKLRTFLISTTPVAAYLTIGFTGSGFSDPSIRGIMLTLGTATGLLTATGVMYIVVMHRSVKAHVHNAIVLYNDGL